MMTNYLTRADFVLSRFARIAAKDLRPLKDVVAHVDPTLARAMINDSLLERAGGEDTAHHIQVKLSQRALLLLGA